MYRPLGIVIVLLALAARIDSQSPRSVAPDPRQIEIFFAQLQRASLADDRQSIAAMIRYPITVTIGGLRVPFADAAAFLQRYDDIFNPTLRDAIARASVSRGAVAGTNAIVITEVNGQLLVTSITVPRDDEGPPAPVGAAERSSGTATKRDPRRVVIRVGPRPTQIPGWLGREGTDVLLVYLPKGKLAGIRLERVPAGTAVLRVVHARTGAPLDARISADGRYVSGRAPESADYRVEVRRIGSVDEGPRPYMLSLTLR